MTKRFSSAQANQSAQGNQVSSQNPHFGQSNSMMMAQLQNANQSDSQKVQQLTTQLRVADNVVMTSDAKAFQKTNVYKAMVRLVTQEGWEPAYAAAWLGQAVVETGNSTLQDLDVVENGGRGAGRGDW